MTSADPVRTPPESVEALTLEQPTRSVQQYFAVLGAGAVGLIICVALLMWTSDVTNGPRMEQIWVLIRTMFIAGTVAWLLNPVLLGKARIIQFDADGMVLPAEAPTRSPMAVLYEDVRSVAEHHERVVIETASRVFRYQAHVGADLVLAAITGRLDRRPNGAALVETLQRRSRTAQAFLERRLDATWVLMAMLFAYFVFQCSFGLPGDTLNLVRTGAGSRVLILDGQFHRLFSAVFMHANTKHLFMNLFALWLAGFALERAIGTSRFILVFLVSGFASSLAALLWPVTMFVGSSGAVFGVIAARAVHELPVDPEMPLEPRYYGAWQMNSVYVNAAVGVAGVFWTPEIDWIAPLCGVIAGALCMYGLSRGHRRGELLEPEARPMRLAAAMLIGTFSSLLVTSGMHASDNHAADLLRIQSTSARPLTTHGRTQPIFAHER